MLSQRLSGVGRRAQSSVLIFISDCCSFAGPVLLQQLLEFLEDRSSIGAEAAWQAETICFTLWASQVLCYVLCPAVCGTVQIDAPYAVSLHTRRCLSLPT